MSFYLTQKISQTWSAFMFFEKDKVPSYKRCMYTSAYTIKKNEILL